MPSAPPPSGAGAGRADTIAFESGRRMAPDALRLTPNGATLEVEGLLQQPLKLTLGQLHIGLVDRGPAKVKGQGGRFPVLRRLSATAVIPREQGIEGWLWTSTGGSALTVLGDEDAAPTGALLFTKPLGPDQLKEAMTPAGARGAGRALAARRPGGAGRPVPRRRARQRRDGVPRLRPPAPADRPRGPADDAPLAADRQIGGSDDPNAFAGPEGLGRAAGLLACAAEMTAPTEHDPSTCTACRGTGELISGLGGEPHRVPCPWCEGTGRFDASRDAQAPARDGHPADAQG